MLNRLRGYVEIGPYLFVHAGVHPDRPLAEHGLHDLLRMREPFLDGAGWSHPFTVVHGHTPLGSEVFPHRIGIDSGCFSSNVLTAVELEGDRLCFHAVSGEADPQEFHYLLQGGPPREFSAAEPVF